MNFIFKLFSTYHFAATVLYCNVICDRLKKKNCIQENSFDFVYILWLVHSCRVVSVEKCLGYLLRRRQRRVYDPKTVTVEHCNS